MNPQLSPHECVAFLVRHGATDNNLANPPRLQGRTVNGPLSEVGRSQAAAAASCLSDEAVTAVYSSPLRRAHETATEIARPHALQVRSVNHLVEVDVGDWEGRSWVEIEQTEPEPYAQFQQNPAQHGYRNGENLNQVSERVLPAVLQLMQEHHGQHVVIVAHNVVNRVLLATALGLPLPSARNLSQHNCGINTLRLRDGQLKVVTLNANFHLRS